jgi:hypothetical protein
VSRAEIKRAIDAVWFAIDAEVNHSCRYYPERSEAQNRMAYGLQERWRRLNQECVRQEREHRAFGRRLNQSLRGRASVELAARYFAAMGVIREVPEVRTWFTATDIRSDWALGHALAECFEALCIWPEIHVRLGADALAKLNTVARVDYAKDLV